MVAAGNCSNWTSKALHLAGLVDRPHTLPKSIFIDMFEEFVVRQNCADAKVVVYLQAESGKLSPTPTDPSQRRTPQRFDIVHGMCSPFMPVRQRLFWDILPYADAIVSIDDSAVFQAIAATEDISKGGRFELREGELAGGVGCLTVECVADSDESPGALAKVKHMLERAKGKISASARPGPGLRCSWYRYFLRWRLHTMMVGTCVVCYLLYGFPCEDSRWSALLARTLLALLGLVVHAAFA